MNERLVKQEALLRMIARALENFKKFGRQNYTPSKIRSRISSFKEIWSQCIDGHAVLLCVIPEKDQFAIDYFKEDQLDIHEEIYQKTLDIMTEWLEDAEPPVSPNQLANLDRSLSRSDVGSLSLRHLPPIKLPPFSGNFQEWETFRDRFTALIENKELNDFIRMHFLASSLTGPARDVISGFAITADYFTVAWKALFARFENKRKLIDTHIATLYNLPILSRESAVELHALRDRADRSISALRSLGRADEEILSDILVYFVAQKLDPSTRRAWKLKCSKDKSPSSFDELNSFISARAVALEELLPLSSKPTRNVKANNATTSDASETCIICKQAHFFGKCAQFLRKTPSQRREIVKGANQCFNCLSSRHSVQDCLELKQLKHIQSRFSCRVCQQRHHSSLHFDSGTYSDVNNKLSSSNKFANVSTVAPGDASQSANTVTPEHVVAMSSVSVAALLSPVLLATAKVTVESPEGRKLTVRALLDQGFLRSYIYHRNLVANLASSPHSHVQAISTRSCSPDLLYERVYPTVTHEVSPSLFAWHWRLESSPRSATR